jgi:3-oxoadipate enol-lactonase
MAHANVNETNIYYEVKGNPEGTETVAFFNGVMSSVRSWDAPVSILERCGFKILLHDFRGQLLSEKPEENYTFSMHAKDAKGLSDLLEIKKLHIVGTSYGAIVGLRFALDYPEYVKSITLVDTLTELDNFVRWIASEWISLARQGDIKKLFRNAAPIIYSCFYMASDFAKGLVLLLENTIKDANLTAEISQIKSPVLIVCGENDLLAPLKFSKIIYDNIPQAEFIIIPECGHAAIYEKPDVIGSLVLGFVTKHSDNFFLSS